MILSFKKNRLFLIFKIFKIYMKSKCRKDKKSMWINYKISIISTKVKLKTWKINKTMKINFLKVIYWAPKILLEVVSKLRWKNQIKNTSNHSW